MLSLKKRFIVREVSDKGILYRPSYLCLQLTSFNHSSMRPKITSSFYLCLQLPIPLCYTQDFPILQYAYDTLIVMEGCPSQLLHLKGILSDYAVSTGLKVNYSKSMLVPINMDENRMNFLAQTFGCSVGETHNHKL